MLRLRIAAMLRQHEQIGPLLSGGVYPVGAADESAMDPKFYPAAFDGHGEIRPTALVRDASGFGAGFPGMGASQAIVDVLLWAPDATALDAALPLIRKLLEGARADTDALHTYPLRFAGQAQSLRDPALDCEHAWSRWQAATVLK